jgi:hypothetical protein
MSDSPCLFAMHIERNASINNVVRKRRRPHIAAFHLVHLGFRKPSAC